ncbi:5'-3' exoribonuclease 1 [Toxorhynchites rutilus septentrionalis]|uniref:5'-3' exoribonuclease 1 n=1 Tax=Toxorhynchites rutilus septentrionalis TaxID=329112 RepID=UPI002478882D|nr:5'-3' exoribonuclease 1 [Toxorhynchites rutilus septentrionalis]
MGVPKFFRYISERYPCLSELVRENQVPQFDNLYLDMNGIIHNCSHPNDSDVFFRITEEKIFSDIFHYLEFLFRMIRPQKLFFIAVDGVAPRAKMNQQRGRRFRSAREAQEQLEEAEKKGEILPKEARFDSNCITPGTGFMVRLQRAMEHFINIKVSTNPLWKHCKVILSGHETPGEGEHKIIEYIKYAKASPNYDPNTRHCLYGLDADLIMLGLCTHERHFSLLREEVKFGKNVKKTTVVEEMRFYLLHLTLMREYLELEFAPVRDQLSFEFNIYKLIDDWVLMGFMVGNDFIPHLPHLHINENALPTLFQAYMDILPTLDGHINESGKLNLPRFEVLMNRLSRFDRDIFLEHYTDLKYFQSKRGQNNMEAFDATIDEITASDEMDCDLAALIKASEDMFSDDEEDESVGDLDNPDFFEKEFTAYKRNYYITKLGYKDYDENVRAEQAECYIRALQWTLEYYYRGVPSWGWFYPHHYAPFISDVQDFKDLVIDFELGRPFLPFQQLLSVLPIASKDHIPSAYHCLMIDPNSPVKSFYPEEFSTDLNGKQQQWEAVVLIPFINEKKLLEAMEPCDAFLTDEEKQRNVHSAMKLYQYDEKGTSSLPASYGFERVEQLKVKEIAIYREDLRVPDDKLVLGPTKGAILDGYIKGFPTMKHLKYHGILKEARVKVFNFPSRNQSMVVVIDRPLGNPRSTEALAKELLGRIVYVSWPHLIEAKVVKISDAESAHEKDREVQPNNKHFFSHCIRSIVDHHSSRLAIDLGRIEQLVHVKTCVGSEYVLRNNRYVLHKLWNMGETAYPIQAIVTDLREALKTLKPYQEIQEMFPENCSVFLKATQWYGSLGHVVDVTAGHQRIKTRFEIYEEPSMDRIMDINDEAKNHYMGVHDAASTIGISSNLLNRLSSTIYMMPGGRRSINVDERGKMNIGLQLRLVSQDEETVGYTKKVNKYWMFSEKTIDLITRYHEQFPFLFERLESCAKGDVLFEDEIFGKNKEHGVGLKDLIAWIKAQDHVKAEKRPCGTQTLEPAAIQELLAIVDQHKTKLPIMQTMFVYPKNLYRPGMVQAKSIDAQANFELLDRVIVARETEVVPLGYRGTIIGIYTAHDPNPVRQECVAKEDKYYDILFDNEFPNGVQVYGMEATKNRVVRLSEGAVLNISYGTAEFECKQIADPQPTILPAEEFLAGRNQQQRIQQKTELIRVLPVKPTPTAESIKKRMNERIEKKNPTKAFVIANRKPQEACSVPETDMQAGSFDFERLWNKLRGTSQAPVTFDDRDIKRFISTNTTAPNGNAQAVSQSTISNENSKPSSANSTADPTDMLKKMLKISDNESRLLNQEVMSESVDCEKNVINAKPSTTTAFVQQNSMPTPKSLPKPPSSWRALKKSPGVEKYTTPTTQQKINPPVHSQPAADTTKIYYDGASQNHIPHMQSQAAILHQPYGPSFQQYTATSDRVYHSMVPPHSFGQQQFQPMLRLPNYQTAPMLPLRMMHQQSHQRLYRPQQFQGSYVNNPRQCGPNGPQNLSFNRNTPAGTGAFVPLQAMINAQKRNVVCPTGTSNVSKKSSNQQPTQANVTTAFAQKNAELRQIVEKKQEECKQGFASFLAETSGAETVIPDKHKPAVEMKCDNKSRKKDDCLEISTPDTTPPPKVRHMKIAARFSQT